MAEQDIRWVQRYRNFQRAFQQLDEAVQLGGERALSKLEKQGVIQAFEYTWELAWTTLRDFLKWQGISTMTGSRDTIREAFANGLVEDGEGWMAMLQDRNRTSHTYNEETAEQILQAIFNRYHGLFLDLKQRFEQEISRHGLH
ncbi:nucleotidyltransferase substrate binding protein, HI0074 family [Marinobacter daqiaonensis]|uniref:Nucleotidyltransferase substrate binding protein, HI0074 family n=1 Tax=Marinobacter daqiaonensis TaxID=650891 RepID=A0A1I6HAC5_9GAMM|nr:nucleotidyltransferase substrate binding protein [Marinobacter daqiaonensis]SFR51456.1 nucleotidyltransferase substrate binding protein, HI0074 family [Marinobacter daqiaonensis]